jgi:rhamnose transport system permease protein
VPAVLIIVVLFVGHQLSSKFLDFHYLLDNSTVYMETGLIALGMTMVIISGAIDLSVGSNLILTSCLTAKLMEKGWGIPASIAAACCIGAFLGFINGVLVAKLKLPSFLVTLGTMAAYRGTAQAMMGASSVKLPKGFVGLDEKLLWGIPWPVVIFLIFALVAGFLLHQTVFGRWTFALGTNQSASKYSGIPNDRVTILLFTILGLLCGIGALLIDSRLGVARYDLAQGLELDAITVAVVGGAAITGGTGTMLGTVLALFLIDLMHSAMGMAKLKSEFQLTAIGILLIVVVLCMNATQFLKFRTKPAAAGKT